MAVVIDMDNGYAHVVKEIMKLDGKSVEAGIHATAGREDGTDLVDIAIYNEYGTKRIPSRPFVRLATDNNQKEWDRIVDAGHAAIVAGTRDADFMLNVLGNRMVADIQKTIGNRQLLVPNAPATVKKKGSDAPLIDSGRLRQSVDYVVKG